MPRRALLAGAPRPLPLLGRGLLPSVRGLDWLVRRGGLRRRSVCSPAGAGGKPPGRGESGSTAASAEPSAAAAPEPEKGACSPEAMARAPAPGAGLEELSGCVVSSWSIRSLLVRGAGESCLLVQVQQEQKGRDARLSLNWTGRHPKNPNHTLTKAWDSELATGRASFHKASYKLCIFMKIDGTGEQSKTKSE